MGVTAVDAQRGHVDTLVTSLKGSLVEAKASKDPKVGQVWSILCSVKFSQTKILTRSL